MDAVLIRPLGPSDADACDRIVASLPYHFGVEQGRRDCATAVRSETGLVAVEDDEVVGFLTYVPRFDEAAEITWMAVRDDRRRQGIGHRLIDRLTEFLRTDAKRVLIALTVSPNDPGSEPEDGYAATRAFYRSCGFVLARDLRAEWETDTAVVMVKPLLRAGDGVSRDASARHANGRS
ncbi:MAG TPA: GNAT family N-acetyltransferase [Actinomycetota bacterium]|nr:GNAT family N-acetyltransferase [Actinomycetota bacterium]